MAQQGGLGTGRMVCQRNSWLSGMVWHRKDGVPKRLCGSVRWSRRRKDGVPKKLCGSVRWSRHRNDGAPKKLVAQYGGLGTGKMVCLRNFVAQ